MQEWQTRLQFGRRRRPPVVLQTEAAECGLACLAMLAAWHGLLLDLPTLRRRFNVSLKGTTLKQLVGMAAALDLSARAVRLELDELADLKTPCVLHWDLNHFVVLVRANRTNIWIIDPASGERRMPLAAASRHFSGVALEVSASAAFHPSGERRTIPLRRLTGRVVGWKRSVAHVLALAVALEVCSMTAPFFVQWTVDGAVVSADRDFLLMLALGFSLLMVIQTAVTFARSWVVLFVSTHLSLQWSSNILGHLLRLPMQWFERRHLGDVLSRFGSVGTIQRTLTTSLIEAVIDGLLTIATLLLMLFYSAMLTSIVVAAVTMYALLRSLAYPRLLAATEEQIVLSARANSMLMESVRAAAAIKLFGAEEDRRVLMMNVTVDATNRVLATEKMSMLYRSAQAFLSGTENVLVVYFGAVAVIGGSFSVGMLFAFIAYKATFSSRVAALIDKSVQVAMLRLQLERLADIVLEEPEQQASDISGALSDTTIDVRNISFRYGDGEPWVLRNISFTILPGECVAIVGKSACGKTTLLKILLGLLAPTQGEIRVGGRSIDRIGLRTYRRLVGAVMQEDQLLAGSIAENIAFFDMSPARARIEVCARIAAVHDEILAMPMAYSTLIGDMGSALSGGQKQRILLARALYKQPKLLFLDEATSHLDVKKEREINRAVRLLNFTRILVAHRPETIASADRVIVLDEGTVKQDCYAAQRDEATAHRADLT